MNIWIRMALERQRLEQRQIQEQRAYYEVRYIKYIERVVILLICPKECNVTQGSSVGLKFGRVSDIRFKLCQVKSLHL